MRVLVLSQYYDPEPIPRPVEIAEELARRGHEVNVLTGLPNYPTGRLAPGYRLRPYIREVIRGIPVTRVLEIPYHGPSGPRRLVNYASFAAAAAVAAVALPRPDAVFVCHPPLTIAVAAWVIRSLRRAPFVYDVQDIWPDAILMSGMIREGRVANALRALEMFAYRHAARVVVVTEGARANLLRKGVPPAKVVAIPPWPYGMSDAPPTAAEVERARADLDGRGRFVVTFAGNVGRVQHLETAVRAAEVLRERRDIALRIVGDGLERQSLEALTRSLALDNMRFLGLRAGHEIPALLAASDALLVHLRAGPLTDLYLPAKTLGYLFAGRPILMAMTGEAAELVQSCDAGITLPPEEPRALADAIARLAGMPASERDAMGERGRSCATARFSRSVLVGRLEGLLEEATRT